MKKVKRNMFLSLLSLYLGIIPFAMKNFLLTLALVLFSLSVYSQWYQHTDIPVSTNLSGITFIDSFHGWILGDSGTILHTNDGGSTWEIQYCPVGVSFGDISMIDSLNGWIVGHGPDTSGYILKTTDGGTNWILQDVSLHNLQDVCFTDSLHGWMIGESGERLPCMLRSTFDGGATWSEAIINEVQIPYDVIFTDSMTGFIGGTYHNGSDLCARIIKTTDGGATWQVKLNWCSDPFCFYNDMAFANDSVGWLVGESWIEGIHGAEADFGFIMATQDGGETWHEIFSDEIFPVEACLLSDQSGWAVGGDGFFMYTGNGGNTWDMMNLPPEESLYDIFFIDDDTGWAVGTYGTVMYTNNNGTMEVPEVPDDPTVLKAVPNPAHGELTMNFTVDKGGPATVELVDLSGRTVVQMPGKMLFDGPNRLTLQWGNEVTPGIYFLRIVSTSGILTGKILVE